MTKLTLSTEPRDGMFCYRIVDPIYRQWQTIDSGKRSEAEAFADLRRYVNRENRRRATINTPKLPALKHPAQMTFIAAAPKGQE